MKNIDGNWNFLEPVEYFDLFDRQLLRSISEGDINGDGFIDLVVSTSSSAGLAAELSVLINNSAGVFVETKLVSTISEEFFDLQLTDIDEDGDLDIMAAEPKLDKIGWFENTDGSGNFDQIEKVIDTSVEGLITLDNVDLDGDGDEDILVGGGKSNLVNVPVNVEMAFFEKIGPSQYGEKKTLEFFNDADFGIGNIQARDMDADGLSDIVVDLNVQQRIYWRKNLGNLEFEEKVAINSLPDFFLESNIGDVDNDGDLDIITFGRDRVLSQQNIWKNSNVIQVYHPSQIREALIDTDSRRIELEVANELDISEGFDPEIIVSPSATFSLSSNDFSSPVIITVEGENGSISNWTIIVTQVPSTPSLSINEVLQNSASLSWNNIDFVEQYELQVRTDPFFGGGFVTGFDPLSIASSSTSQSIDDIVPGFRYYARIRAFNKFNSSSEYSDRIDFVTIPATPTLNNINISNISESSARVSWNELPGLITAYKVFLEIENEDGSFELVDDYPIEINSSSIVLGEDFNTNQLESGSRYKVYAQSFNESGSSGTSNVLEFKTRSSAEDISFSAQNITPRSFQLNWTESKGALGYLLSISDDDFETFVGSFNNFRINRTDTAIINLNSGQLYSIRLVAINETGISDNEITIKVRTLPSTPTILPVELLKVTTRSAEIDWNPVSGTGISYEVEVSLEDFNSVTNAAVIEGYPLEISETSIELGRDFSTPRLNPGTDYYVRVRAKNSTGFSNYSQVVSFSSITVQPIVKLDKQSIGADSVNISWSEVTGADEYLLDVSLDNFQTIVPGYSQLSITNNEFTVSGLTDGEFYFLRLYAKNSSGLSLVSNTNEVLLKPGTPLARGASEISPIQFTANWDPVQRAGSYQLQISEQQEFSELLMEESYNEANPVTIENLEEGQEYYYRVRSENETGFSAFSNIISVQTVNPDPLTTSLTFDELFDPENDNVVAVLVNGGFGEREVTYRWKPIGSTIWSEFLEPTQLSFGQYQFTIVSSMLDLLGTEFEVKVIDELGREEVDGGNFMFISVSSDDDIAIPITEFGGNKNSWQIFSIPFELEDNLIESIFDEVTSKEYKKEWRLMHYRSSGNSGSYIDFGEGLNRIEIGKSYWFNAIDRVTVEIGDGQVSTQVPFSLSLEQGWNQIGNPYPVNIDWSRVLLNNQASGTVGSLVTYDGVNPVRSGDLEPFKGGFVFAEEAIDIAILPSNSATATSGRVDASSSFEPSVDLDDGWFIDLNVVNQQTKIDQASFGMVTGASALKDRYDLMKIPRFISYTDLSSVVPGYFHSSFERDIRPDKQEEVWNFQFSSNELKGQTKVEWDIDQVLSVNQPLFLVDITNGSIVDMRQVTKYVVPAEGRSDLRVFYGSELDEIEFGDVLLIGDIYPNPIVSELSIPFVFPASSQGWDVEVKMFNVQGREVYSDAFFSSFSGYNTQFIDLSAQDIKAGVYLMSIAVKGQKELIVQQKIIVK